MTRARPNRLGMYEDVKRILDAALATGGGTYTLASHGLAVNWRHRAYRFRKLYATIHGEDKMSPYDRLTFKAVEADSSTVTIALMGESQAGVFTPREGGDPLDISVPDEDLLIFAESLKKKIEGE